MKKNKAKNKQLRQRQETVKHLLAESREVERKEKAASEAKNEDLFVIDTAAAKKKQANSETVQQASAQDKKKQLQQQIKLFDPMHMLQEKYGDTLLKPLGKDLPTPTPTSLAQTKKRKREEEAEEARKAKRPRKEQTVQVKKPAVFDLWAADAPVKACKKPRHSTAKMEFVKPHAGQSYNPTEDAHQAAIEMAYEGELELYTRAKQIKKKLSYDENHPAVASGTGDDVLDGFNMQDKVDEVEDLTQENATTELHQKILTRKKKMSREKKRNVNKHKKLIRQRVERMKNATAPHPKRVMKAIDEYLDQSMKAKLALRAEEDAKKKAPIASVNGAIDVPLKEELSENMRTIKVSSETLFSDAMRAMNKSGLFTPKSMRRHNMKWGEMIVK